MYVGRCELAFASVCVFHVTLVVNSNHSNQCGWRKVLSQTQTLNHAWNTMSEKAAYNQAKQHINADDKTVKVALEELLEEKVIVEERCLCS